MHTPEIPPACQWCLFLRNHDELTLEMVSDEERRHLYYAYGSDPRMRLNLGIRRRLAPLLENDRRKIELLTSLLFTLPGSPILYYGDEIGMGDNIYLGDRNGVRTPMQWTGDRNAGFSRADTARLYLPLIVDTGLRLPGDQRGGPAAHPVLAAQLDEAAHRGAQEDARLRPRHAHASSARPTRACSPTCASTRARRVIAVHNLAGSAQPVELDLRAWRGHTPVEMLGDTRFPTIGSSPYFISLAPYGYYWFRLQPPLPDQPLYGIEAAPL